MSGLDMELASGVAAFEAKEFAQAMQLLLPLAEKAKRRRNIAWPSWPRSAWAW